MDKPKLGIYSLRKLAIAIVIPCTTMISDRTRCKVKVFVAYFEMMVF